MKQHDRSTDSKLLIPALDPVYRALAPLAETWLRIISGAALMVHGWPKLLDPMRSVGTVERIGFAPSWFWSPALGITEFFGGLLLVIGLFVRPAALAVSVVLLVTIYFHWVLLEQGYEGSELSLIWSAVTLYFAARGAGRFSVDAVIGRNF